MIFWIQADHHIPKLINPATLSDLRVRPASARVVVGVVAAVSLFQPSLSEDGRRAQECRR